MYRVAVAGTRIANEDEGITHATAAANVVALELVGQWIREERTRQRIGVRELARRVGVSASLISQVELGRASPSVATLFSIVGELGLSLDELFSGQPSRAGQDPTDGEDRPTAEEPGSDIRAIAGQGAASAGPVVRRGSGKALQLATGVTWERLTPGTPDGFDFLYVTYKPGSESCPPDALMTHSGHEYGYVISGRLGVTIGFDTYVLAPGDSVSFDSTLPHRLFAIGDEPAIGIWFDVGRRGDPRLGHRIAPTRLTPSPST